MSDSAFTAKLIDTRRGICEELVETKGGVVALATLSSASQIYYDLIDFSRRVDLALRVGRMLSEQHDGLLDNAVLPLLAELEAALE